MSDQPNLTTNYIHYFSQGLTIVCVCVCVHACVYWIYLFYDVYGMECLTSAQYLENVDICYCVRYHEE